MRRLLPFALVALVFSPLLGDEEAPPSPDEQPYRPGQMRRFLEIQATNLNWNMTYLEDDDLLVAGTCDAKLLEETKKLARKTIEKATALLKVDSEEFQGPNKLHIVYFAKKDEYLAYAKQQAEATQNPALTKLLETVPASGGMICLDKAYGVNDAARCHLAVHNLAHQILGGYARHRKGMAAIPGWVREGFPSWMDGVLNTQPSACCIARVGYDDDQFQRRDQGASWNQTAAAAMRAFRDKKNDPKTGKPAYTRMGNLMGIKFDKLTGTDVAVSWRLTRDLIAIKQGEPFKAFLDAVLDGGKQADAFQAAFGKPVDDFETGWMSEVLRSVPADPPKKKP